MSRALFETYFICDQKGMITEPYILWEQKKENYFWTIYLFLPDRHVLVGFCIFHGKIL